MDYAIAFRWFHKNIPTNLWLVDGSGETVKEFPFSNTYLSFDLIKTNYSDFLRGMMKQPQRMSRVGYDDEVCCTKLLSKLSEISLKTSKKLKMNLLFIFFLFPVPESIFQSQIPWSNGWRGWFNVRYHAPS